ncbi:hypothetical protein FJTKL_02760 [Diaporthe vaccinii]|uniref:Uncharacterized protein n=1 Tax=Diaporthe vaccinii TaxID=105482 RepID=A0ABR4DWN1_9PEZI
MGTHLLTWWPKSGTLVADMTFNTIKSDPIPGRNKTNSEGLGTVFNGALEAWSTTAKSSASRKRRMVALKGPDSHDQWRCNVQRVQARQALST